MKIWLKELWIRWRHRHCRIGSRYDATKYCYERAVKAAQKEIEDASKTVTLKSLR